MRGNQWYKGTIGLQAAVPKNPHTRPLILTFLTVDRTGDSQAYGESAQLVDLETLENGVIELKRRHWRKKHE